MKKTFNLLEIALRFHGASRESLSEDADEEEAGAEIGDQVENVVRLRVYRAVEVAALDREKS